jgi:hypothetical protein
MKQASSIMGDISSLPSAAPKSRHSAAQPNGPSGAAQSRSLRWGPHLQTKWCTTLNLPPCDHPRRHKTDAGAAPGQRAKMHKLQGHPAKTHKQHPQTRHLQGKRPTATHRRPSRFRPTCGWQRRALHHLWRSSYCRCPRQAYLDVPIASADTARREPM